MRKVERLIPSWLENGGGNGGVDKKEICLDKNEAVLAVEQVESNKYLAHSFVIETSSKTILEHIVFIFVGCI